MVDGSGRFTLEECEAMPNSELRRHWAHDMMGRYNPASWGGFWDWGLFSIKADESYFPEEMAQTILQQALAPVQSQMDSSFGDLSLTWCWHCVVEQVAGDDDLGLCKNCVEHLRFPEKTTWRRERAAPIFYYDVNLWSVHNLDVRLAPGVGLSFRYARPDTQIYARWGDRELTPRRQETDDTGEVSADPYSSGGGRALTYQEWAELRRGVHAQGEAGIATSSSETSEVGPVSSREDD